MVFGITSSPAHRISRKPYRVAAYSARSEGEVREKRKTGDLPFVPEDLGLVGEKHVLRKHNMERSTGIKSQGKVPFLSSGYVFSSP